MSISFISARSGLSTWNNFVSRADVTMFVDSFIATSRGKVTPHISLVQIRDSTKHTKVNRIFPNRELHNPRSSRAKAEKPPFRVKIATVLRQKSGFGSPS